MMKNLSISARELLVNRKHRRRIDSRDTYARHAKREEEWTRKGKKRSEGGWEDQTHYKYNLRAEDAHREGR